jgi:hypothetical protein
LNSRLKTMGNMWILHIFRLFCFCLRLHIMHWGRINDFLFQAFHIITPYENCCYKHIGFLSWGQWIWLFFPPLAREKWVRLNFLVSIAGAGLLPRAVMPVLPWLSCKSANSTSATTHACALSPWLRTWWNIHTWSWLHLLSSWL